MPMEVVPADDDKVRKTRNKTRSRGGSSAPPRKSSLIPYEERHAWETPDLDKIAEQDETVEVTRQRLPRLPFGLSYKNLIDSMLLLSCVVLVIVAHSLRTQPLKSPGKCAKTPEQDYACFAPPKGLQWDNTTNFVQFDPLTNISSVVPAVTFNMQDSKRICKMEVDQVLTKPGQPSFNYGLTSAGLKAALSMIPFILIFQGILSFNMSSKKVAPIVLLVVIYLGLNFFRDAEYFAGDALTEALGKVVLTVIDRFFWTILDYAANVFSAFFFLRVLELWGIVDSMRLDFERISDQPNHQIILVGYCFAIALAVVAPGGTNYVIAGSILISMNLTKSSAGSEIRKKSNIAIGAIALFGNALTSAFNLLGVCVVAIAEDLDDKTTSLDDSTREIGRLLSLQFFLFSTLSPVIMLYLFNSKPTFREKWHDIKGDFLEITLIGAVLSTVQLLTAAFVGPQLVNLLGGASALVAYILLLKIKKAGSTQNPSGRSASRLYMIPFLLLVTILLLYGIIPGAKDFLSGKNTPASPYIDPVVFEVTSGGLGISHSFPYLYHSGVVVMVIALLTPFIVPYKRVVSETTGMILKEEAEVSDALRRKQVLFQAWNDSVGDGIPVVISITSFGSIARLMGQFEMTQSIAMAIVNALQSSPGVYALVMPVIGMLGSGLTGSTTTSNFLFGRLQVNTAKRLGLLNGKNSVWEVAAIQILGSSAGEIISPMNAVVITIMDGVGVGESTLIGMLLPAAFLWLIGTMLMSAIFILPPGGFIN